MVNEDGKTLYTIKRLYDIHGKVMHDPVTNYGFLYEVRTANSEFLGIEPYLSYAKGIAERHLAKKLGGEFTGY